MVVACLLAVAGAWLLGHKPSKVAAPKAAAGAVSTAAKKTAAGTNGSATATSRKFPTLNTNALAYRLANTTNSIRQLEAMPHAILLANAFIDTDKPLNFTIPENLRSAGDPGSYIVQAKGPIDMTFRAALASARAGIVSYIPNNAYLVNVGRAGAAQLAGNPAVQAVLPYEPYYKLQSSLLGLAVNQEKLPPGTTLTLGLFGSDPKAVAEIEQMGVPIVGRDQSPFGPIVKVLPPDDWTALVQSKAVQYVEPMHARRMANDLSRVAMGISPDTTSPMTNGYAVNGYVLLGNNVLVAVNDSGIDAAHPDFGIGGSAQAPDTAPPSRVLESFSPLDLVDTNGHGTFVAGEIAGNGSMSTNPVDVGMFAEGSVPGADFRGKAPLAWLLSANAAGYSDYQLQTNAALRGALISNNSWDYGNGNSTYDLAAASYDFATRDAVPGQTGSQPMLFVFAAGNNGGGSDDGTGGTADSIVSPGTAKNVITVGSLEQYRYITNIVTQIVETPGTNTLTTNEVAYWEPWTDSDDQVAGYSSRGNVGIGTEGAYGRFKPDVVSPGTFVVSTSSQFNGEMNTNAYYNPTNIIPATFTYQVADTNALLYYPGIQVPDGAVGVNIYIYPNDLSPVPFPTNFVIYIEQTGNPDPVGDPGAIDITTYGTTVSIPPASGGAIASIGSLAGNGFNVAIGVTTNITVNFNVEIDVLVTNSEGDLYAVLEQMNDSLGGYYRYETGTSMAAAGVSGLLALIDDYFTNKLDLIPSPALVKALLINGARSVGDYGLDVTNGINFQGWGIADIQTAVPYEGLFDTPNGNTTGSTFFAEQNPSTALATGDSHTYLVTVSTNAQTLYLQATLVWTDPPGDPSAAIKLVNNLDLIITNLDTGDVNSGAIYVGNDISSDIGYNLPASTNGPLNLDTVNNVENVIIHPGLAGKYSVTVVGRNVNVNAVTAQTNNYLGQYAPNIVQDYALVIAVGEGEVTNAITVKDGGYVSDTMDFTNVTYVASTNAPLMNQIVGASSPLMGTNKLNLGTATQWGSSGVLTIGETNQWHFYVVTNTGGAADFTNAAFLIFGVNTLSIPRMGVYEDRIANATTPEANLDLFVSTNAALLSLDPNVISNCLAGANNSRAALANAGTQFAFYTNSAPGEVYYIGVQSEDQMAAEYSFLPVFTDVPFSSLDQNGNQIVNGLLLPMQIPDSSNGHPGVTNVFALAVIPMEVEKVTVTNQNTHQNFGDLLGTLEFGGKQVVLNNHDAFHDTTYVTGTPRTIVYDDSENHPLGTTNTDGPGSLTDFQALSALGPWILSELDDSPGNTGQVRQLTLLIQPHRNLKQPGIFVAVPPGGWFYDWVDVPAGYTNLTFYGTNVTTPFPGAPYIQMYEKLGNDPTLTDYDQEATLTNGNPPGNSISVGPPLPMGRYFVGLYNPNSTISQTIFLSATLGVGTSANDVYNYVSGSAQSLSDDAVTPTPAPIDGATPSAAAAGSTIVVPAGVTNLVGTLNVGIVVNSPRISDYAFTLVSPDGQRVLLMQNRGGTDTNGAGATFVYTNVVNALAKGGGAPQTNYLTIYPNLNGVSIPLTWNFYTVPDEMTVYTTTNPADFITNTVFCIYDTGFASNAPAGGGGGAENTIPYTTNLAVAPGITNITIIMNQYGNPYAGQGDAWTYTAGAPSTNYEYLMFTDDTNLANVPIKFANPPFSLTGSGTNFTLSDLDQAVATNYYGPTNIPDGYGNGWSVPTNFAFTSIIESNAQFLTVTNLLLLPNNLVSVVSDRTTALGGDAGGSNYLALGDGTITRTIPTIPGHIYNVTFWYRGPGIEGWWRGEGNGNDSSDPENNNNNGALIGRFNFPAGEVGQAFGYQDTGATYEFAGTNTYVQVPASGSLNVGAGGGFTVEGWINPTNLTRPEPLVEWLAQVPTNSATADPNLKIVQGPVLDEATGHYYYLLAATNWIDSEIWAKQLGGDLATLETANEGQWIYDTFTAYGTLNRDLWIGLNDFPLEGKFHWIGGSTNLSYMNWVPGAQSITCSNLDLFTAIMGPTNAYPGLWELLDNSGQLCGNPPPNPVYGVVEVPAIPTNGVQFWISGTNWTGATNALQGCLSANIVDTNSVSHWIYSAPGLLTTNVYQHVALTFNTNSGTAALYLNGTNVATSNLFVGGVTFVPKTGGDLLLGYDMSLYTNNFFGGEMDEMSVYGRSLSLAEISAIYQASALTTNRLTGKFDPAVTPAVGLAEAAVIFGSTSNVIFGVNDEWDINSFTFTATTNAMPLTISGIAPGILLDEFTVAEAPQTNLYYFPEQALASLNGTVAAGNWTLEVWDSRAGAYVTNVPQLVNWELSFVLVSNATISATLPPETPVMTTVAPGQVVYYAVPVPGWANEATNIVVSSTLPVSLFYYSPANPPTTAVAPDATLLNNVTGPASAAALITNAAPPLRLFQNETYYLGVSNGNPTAANVYLEVDYDIMGLSNGVPFTDVLTNEYGAERYFSFDVSSNAYEATFQLLQLSGNADLVLHKGGPLPTLNSGNYGSFNNGTVDENIYVLTNSTPVPLSAGRWYLGVMNRGSTGVQYSVLAKELDISGLNLPTSVVPAILNLTNGIPFTWTAGPGAALTNFFHFYATNAVVGGTNVNLTGLRFELFNLSGNVDLTLQSNALPLVPPFFQSSQNPGTSPELIMVFTNNVLTNLATDWYLGVPNHETNTVTYTVIAEILTNLYFPAFPGAQGAGEGAVGAGHAGVNSVVRHVMFPGDSGPNTLRWAVSTNNCTVVFDIGGSINLASPLVITNSNVTIAGETSPGGGITVAGQMTTVTNAHDVVIRDIRFRRGAPDDSFQFVNVSNVIADHISAEWTSDNLVSVLSSSNVTVQWSIMADSLYSTNVNATNPPTGSLLRGGSGSVSFHHNLYAENYSGSPQLGDNLTLDFVNNVIYDWGLFSGLSDGASDLTGFSPNGCTNQLNYVCNYLIAGPDTAAFGTNYSITNIAFFGGNTNLNANIATWIFQTNNFIDSDTNGYLNGSDTGWGMFTNDYVRFARAFPTLPVSVDEAYIAYERVLDFAGVNMALRDTVDTNIVSGVRSQTGTFISAPPLSSMVGWWKGEGNAQDSSGLGNNGTLEGPVGFAAGEVGLAFSFPPVVGGVFSGVKIPASTSLNVGLQSGFTVEAWIKPNDVTAYGPVFEWNNGTNWGVHLYTGYKANTPGPGSLYADVMDNTQTSHLFWSAAGEIVANVFQHVALTYDKASGVATLYRNGVMVGQSTFGNLTPQTSFDLYLGHRPLSGGVPQEFTYPGLIDEATVYKRALSQSEIQSIYDAGSAGKFASASLAGKFPYLDTDQDGLPDFWENTFTPSLVYTNSNNNARTGDGYTDLEEYNNWLAGPHALTTVTNPVGVDLYQLCGESGHLAFFVTNGIQGFVYLTNVLGAVTNTSTLWSNTIAVFTPTNNPGAATNYSGYASFDFFVTNQDTAAYFGPVTVSVIASAVPITYNSNMPPVSTPLTNGVADPTNYGGSDFYNFTVPSGYSGALFEIIHPSGPMALVISDTDPYPSLSSYVYYTNAPAAPANLEIAVLTNSLPVGLHSGTWNMAAVNEAGSNVTYDIKVTLLGTLLPPVFNYPTNTAVITSIETAPIQITCTATDPNSPPLPLTFALVNGPTNMTVSTAGLLSWTPEAAQIPSTNDVQVSVSNGAYSVTNAFTIIALDSNTPPVLPVIPNQVIILPGTLMVTNTATDANIPATPLGYAVMSSVPGGNVPVIDTNGIITWTPTVGQVGSNYLITTVVTNWDPLAVNAPSLSASKSFYVSVLSLLPPGPPQTNTLSPNSVDWYVINVPSRADMATNTLLFSTAPVNLWFSTNLPPSVTNSTDVELLANAISGQRVITPSTVPALVPGGRYYLGVQNTNGYPVTNAVEVTFHQAALHTSYFSVVHTNQAGTNGYLVQWGAPANDQFHLQWSPALAPANWVNFNGVISVTSVTGGTNGAFQYFDDGSQTGGFGTTRFYRLLWLVSPTNTAPIFLHAPGVFYAAPTVPFTYDDSAFDWDLPTQTLSYTASGTLAGGSAVAVSPSGVITWTPTMAQVGQTNNITTIVSDNGVPVASATNSFAVIVTTNGAAPVIGNITAGTNGVTFHWTAPASDQFEIRWTTNLSPANWQVFSNPITSSTTNFIFVDTNMPLQRMKFYQLIQLP